MQISLCHPSYQAFFTQCPIRAPAAVVIAAFPRCQHLLQWRINIKFHSPGGTTMLFQHQFPTRARVQIATLSSNSLRQTAHSHRASVQQAAKLVASILRVAKVTADLAESNGSLPPLYDSHHLQADPGISSGTLRSVIEYGLPLPF